MITGDAHSIEHLAHSHSGLACNLLVERQTQESRHVKKVELIELLKDNRTNLNQNPKP